LDKNQGFFMLLKSFMKIRIGLWIGGNLLIAIALAGCISATAPILTDAQAILGDQIEVHLFNGPKGTGNPHTVVTYQWNGGRYLPRDPSQDFGEFTIHPYEGRDLIVQIRAARVPRLTEFALARRLAERVYLLTAISEEDADEAMRERFCTKTQDAACRISTPEQLFVFARATAAKDEDSGGIAVIVPVDRR
jgi:hypothetical protein